MINEHLMRPGSGSVNFLSDAPVSFTSKVLGWIEGVGCHVVILPTPPTDLGAMTSADVLASAIYTGRVTGRPSRTSLELTGITTWLDTFNESAMQRTGGTPAQWMTTLLINGLSAGAVSGSNVTRRFEKYGQTRREALDVWATLAGVEYEAQPDFTIDAAAPTSLFQFPPRVVITGDAEGPDGEYVGLRGSLIDQGVDASAVSTRVVVLGGADVSEGSDSATVALRTPTGGTPALVSVVSAPTEAGTNTNALASAMLALRSVHREIALSSDTELIRRVLRPGDYMFLHNLAAGLSGTHEVHYRGQTIRALRVRCRALSWPIEDGYGVVIRSNTGEMVDATPFVAWEPSGAFATISDRGAGVARAGRLNPEAETEAARTFRTVGTVTAAAGWTIETVNAWSDGRIVQLLVRATRTGAAIAVNGSNGNTANVTIGTASDELRGSITGGQPLSAGSAGRGVFGYYQPSTGEIVLTAAGGSVDIATGEEISIGGMALVNAAA